MTKTPKTKTEQEKAGAACFSQHDSAIRQTFFLRQQAWPGSARANYSDAGDFARGRNGGRPFKMTPVKLRLAAAAMQQPDTKVTDLCAELGITRQTLYRFVSPKGALRDDGERLLRQSMPDRTK